MKNDIPRVPSRDSPGLPIRGFLLHITHYDPTWCQSKDKEAPFDLDVGLEIVDAMAQVGLNLLVVDCADGLRYGSHPELTRPYSQPVDVLVRLARQARDNDIEVVPLLNFAQSGVFQNNHWFRPHHTRFDDDTYWQYAFEIVDELIAAIRPAHFFHIGMDEDHWRSHRQYVAAIEALQNGLKARHLRAVIWNASALTKPQFEAFKEKSLMAESAISKEVVQVLFDYAAVQPTILNRVRAAGFELWGAPGADAAQVEEMRDALVCCGGRGILLTRWIPCVRANRESLLAHVRTLGMLCCRRGEALP